MRLENKVAIVTGGAKGLGGEMAQTFAREGAKVVAVDMMPLTYENENVEYYQLNVTDGEACKNFFEYVKEKYGKIDILVNNAGITRDAMPMLVTLLGMVYSVIPCAMNILSSPSMIKHLPSSDAFAP